MPLFCGAKSAIQYSFCGAIAKFCIAFFCSQNEDASTKGTLNCVGNFDHLKISKFSKKITNLATKGQQI